MTASQDRWVCPVCEHRFLYLSELVDHVESRHPADNVTVLEPAGGSADHDEAGPGSVTEEVVDPDRGEELSVGGSAAEAGAALGLEPFEDFRSAARAVMEELSRGSDREVSTLLMRLLGTVLAAEARAEEAAEGIDESRDEARDVEPAEAVTDLGGRRTWMDVLAAEEDRCRRHGMGASVVMVRFGDRKEDVVRRAASAVSRQTRAHDKVVRLREDTVAVLAVHCSEDDAAVLAERVLEAMRMERVPVQTAVGSRGHRLDLYGAWEEAERRLGNPPPPGRASG